MPKLKNVTAEEIQAAVGAADDLMSTLHDITDRMEKSYVDDIATPIALARTFNGLTRASAQMVTQVLFKSSLQEQKQELTVLLRRRAEEAA